MRDVGGSGQGGSHGNGQKQLDSGNVTKVEPAGNRPNYCKTCTF